MKDIYQKQLGEMSKKEWRKDLWRSSIKYIAIWGILLILCIPLFLYARGDFDGWFRVEPQKEYIKIKLHESEVKKDFQVETEGKELDLKIEAIKDKGILDLGTFHLEFKRVEIFSGGHSIPDAAFVLYYPPDDWYVKAITEQTKYEEITKPIKKQKVGVDPLFIKEKDFPYEIYPVDEIEITTDKVIRLVDENKTIYDFYVRIKESNPDFNITSINVYSK